MKRSWMTMGLIFVPGTLWGMSFILVDVILLEMPPYTLTAVRSVISAVAMIAVLYGVRGRLPYTWQGWRPYVILGIFNNALPFSLLTLGQTYIPSGLVTIMTSAMPLFTILLAHFFTEERLTPIKGFGMVVGFGGVFVLVGPEVLRGATENVTGMALIIAATFCYAIGAILIRSFFERVRTTVPETGNRGFQFLMEVAATQFVVAAIVLTPASLLLERPWLLSPSLQTWVALVVLSAGITVVAGCVYYYLIDTAGAGAGATSVYLIPLSGVLGSAIFLGQPITRQVVLALAFVLTGIWLVTRQSPEAVSVETEKGDGG